MDISTEQRDKLLAEARDYTEKLNAVMSSLTAMGVSVDIDVTVMEYTTANYQCIDIPRIDIKFMQEL